MSLAKDEIIGLVVAVVVGVAALADFAYRQGKSSSPAPAEIPAAPKGVDPQVARNDFADRLREAFGADQNPAGVTVDTTTLKIRWELCSKQMLERLLHDDKNYQVMNIRQLSGITVPLLKQLGFKHVACDDGRQGLKPAVAAI